MSDVLGDLLVALLGLYSNPWVFLPVVFLYAIAIAVVLPIPIELILIAPIAQGQWGYLVSIALALAAGKTVGAFLVFLLGLRVETTIRRWSDRWRLAAKAVRLLERFVAKTRTLGLYAILSVPLAPDTVTIYLYSLFNPEGRALERNVFLAANFLAAINRVAILVALFVVGVNLLNGA